VQVPYFRSGDRHPLHTTHGDVKIEPAVWDLFRNLSAVEALGSTLGCKIFVISDNFDHRNREAYRHRVGSELAGLHQSKVVLLDPDTGICSGKPSPKHVDAEDIKAAWLPLRGGAWLVLYQHASRRRNWRHDAQVRFAGACEASAVEVFSAPKIVWDVAFLAARKDGR